MVTVDFITYLTEAWGCLWMNGWTPVLTSASESKWFITENLKNSHTSFSWNIPGMYSTGLSPWQQKWLESECVWSGWTVIQRMSVWGSLWFCSLGLNTGTEYSWSCFTRWWYVFTDAVLQEEVTCPNKYILFLCVLSVLCVWFCGI